MKFQSVMNSCPAPINYYNQEQACLIAESFHMLVGKPLLQEITDSITLAKRLFYSRFALVSHNSNAEPVFNYANQTALALFECTWQEFTILPSRLSAEQENRSQRERLLQEVTEKGFIENYTGIRISKTGRRFEIRNAIVWNLVDADNVFRGQAACFNEWQML